MKNIYERELWGFDVRIDCDEESIFTGRLTHKTDGSLTFDTITGKGQQEVYGKLYKVADEHTRGKCVEDQALDSHPYYKGVSKDEAMALLQKGLEATTSAYGKAVVASLRAYAEAWKCETYVRFGMKGKAAQGESGGMPNYQIESISQDKIQPMRYSHSTYDQAEAFKNNNLSAPIPARTVGVILGL